MENSIHLQGIGKCRAIPARDLQVGMLLSWNYSPVGYEVVSIRNASTHYLEIVERNRRTGKETPRRLKKDRLVAASFPKLEPTPGVGSQTPWGIADAVENIADGILFLSTPGHGGFWVRKDLLKCIPDQHQEWAAQWSGSRQWYEEDCCALAVIAAFPEYFPLYNQEQIGKTLERHLAA